MHGDLQILMQQIIKNILEYIFTKNFSFFSCFMDQNYTLFKDFYIKLMKSYLRKTFFSLIWRFIRNIFFDYFWVEYPKTKTHLTNQV